MNVAAKIRHDSVFETPLCCKLACLRSLRYANLNLARPLQLSASYFTHLRPWQV